MIRGIGLRGAVAVNVITMIGIGPLITIPLVLANLAGSLALIGWIAGALVALCDGLVWAELGSHFPGSGGTYVYLRETFGRERWGRLLAFLFNWQFLLFAPFLLASGYIGFSNYAQYFWPSATWGQTHALAIGVGIVTTLALLRPITNVARFGQILGCAAIGTLLIVIVAAAPHVNFHQAFEIPSGTKFGLGFVAGLGGALYITLYDYVGYNDAALLGDEVREPHKTVPLAIVISILLVALLYIALQIGVLGSTPWQTLVTGSGTPTPAGQYVASTIVEHSWGRIGGSLVTILVLITAFASVYGNLLGFSRIPFAAARDGVFLAPFARLHARSHFPYVSLLAIGAASLVASLFTLDFVIQVLTAGIVLIQSVAQIIALVVLRLRGEPAGFRMWLYPLPAIIALAGWLYAFANTGATAIALGAGWLAIGIGAFLLLARARRFWPFAAALLLGLCFQSHVSAQTWNASRIVQQDGTPVFTVDGKPFFVFGAAFFYERMPRQQWSPALERYKAFGINTIDLYVPWNWHEVRDGDFDFSGRTNPRCDLVGLLSEIHRQGYKIILRPGPVIRNEWRNGGYPAWLLTRPEYNMPLHDVLEGRYPATATLQNSHSDDAAAEWMHNPTHMKYAARWLRTVLHTVAPYGDDVIAIALDDDQGAYIDNQTWPAPHFHAYIDYLKSVVQGIAGRDVPLFINTYQMKVTASAPVWAWGNWYQSDAYTIGDHDRTQLEFSTALLQTQPRLPVMVSEFQAGWLQNADEAYPRPADPRNTWLAYLTMLQMGAHGIVNFPLQDTFNPPGYEAPWANAYYAWDAALAMNPRVKGNERALMTMFFAQIVRQYGETLATTRPWNPAAIVWTPSSMMRAPTNQQFAAIAQRMQDEQRRCRALRVGCGMVDLRYVSDDDLRKFSVLIVPADTSALTAVARARISTFSQHGGIVTQTASADALSRFSLPIPDAVVLADADRKNVFLDVVNYGTQTRIDRAAVVRIGDATFNVPEMKTPAGYGNIIPLATSSPPKPEPKFGGPDMDACRYGSRLLLRHTICFQFAKKLPVGMSRFDLLSSGYADVVLRTPSTMLVLSPRAGARSFIFEPSDGDLSELNRDYFSTVGGLRDDVTTQIPVSARDYIGKYTHPIPAGMFNRTYRASTLMNGYRASVELTYDAPDVLPHGALFDRIVTSDPYNDVFTVDEKVTFHGKGVPSTQAHVMRTSFGETSSTAMLSRANAYGFWDANEHRIAMVAWPPGDVTAHNSELHPGNYIVSLTFARNGWRRSVYAIRKMNSLAMARQELATFAASVEHRQGRGRPGANRG